ncbi:MAG: aromatic acid exporter family protein [Clostridium sp.]
MIKYFHSKTFKMALSATIAILISNSMNLQFGATSGIIAILSIHEVKREAFLIVLRRMTAAFIAILFSFVLYMALGNNSVVFGLFLMIYIPFTMKFNLQDGMVVGAVLSTHLLSSPNINYNWIINEVVITIIGISTAMLFNLYMPSLEEEFEKNREEIEENYKLIISDMAGRLMMGETQNIKNEIFQVTEKIIGENKKIAKRICDNYFIFKKDYYYLSYMEMRSAQFETIRRMNKHFSRFYMTYYQTELLSEYTYKVAYNIHKDNNCILLINELNTLKNEYKKMDLPKNRDEFENRALLLQFLNDLEDFLLLKKSFKEYY